MGLAEVLTLIFVVLKLAGLIAWSWWWVFSPMLIVGGVLILLITLALVIGR